MDGSAHFLRQRLGGLFIPEFALLNTPDFRVLISAATKKSKLGDSRGFYLKINLFNLGPINL